MAECRPRSSPAALSRLRPGAPDLRGLWKAVRVEGAEGPLTKHPLNKHIERVEQCGNRVVVTSEGSFMICVRIAPWKTG